jgi:hypothetical protein
LCLAGAYAQLVTATPTGEAAFSALVLGVDTGKNCPSNIIPTTGTWAPACDQPQSPNFPKVYVTEGGFSGIAFTGPADNAISSGAYACPYCYTNGGAVQAWSYDGPNRGKYCSSSKTVAGVLIGTKPRYSQADAYGRTESCVAVGVWVPTYGVASGDIVVPSGSDGSLCTYDTYPLYACGLLSCSIALVTAPAGSAACAALALPRPSSPPPPPQPCRYAGPSVDAKSLAVLPTDNALDTTSSAKCQAFAVDSYSKQFCAKAVVKVAPAPALASTTTIKGQPWSSGTYGGSDTCNTKSSFTSSITRSVADSKACLLIKEDFVASVPLPKPSPPPSPKPSPSPSPSPFPSPSPSPSPKPSPPPCAYSGTYTLEAQGRDASAKGEFLVYNGGSAANCAKIGVQLRSPGQFTPARALWTVDAVDGRATLLTAGRDCPAGEDALVAPSSRTNYTPFLSPDGEEWAITQVGDACDLVTLKSVKRAAKGARAFLSVASTAADRRVFLASKAYLTGRQTWKLVQA